MARFLFFAVIQAELAEEYGVPRPVSLQVLYSVDWLTIGAIAYPSSLLRLAANELGFAVFSVELTL